MVDQIADDIYRLHLPLPFLLNHVNVYLVRGASGWTVIDTGLNHPGCIAAWEHAFDELRIMPAHIEQIIVTHIHPDHFGLAGWLQAQSGAVVRLSPIEQAAANLIWRDGERDDTIRTQMTQCDAPPDLIDAIIEGIVSTRALTLPHPTHETTITPGSQLRIGDRLCTAIHAPGHSDGQLVFFDERDALIFSGDQVLNKITPNIGLWATGDPHPLQHYLASLRALRDLPVRVGLPGHKTVIEEWRGRIDQIIAHHDVRLAHVLSACQNGATVMHVARTLFDFSRLTTHEMRFALVESLAHLEHLVENSALTRDDSGGVWRYEAG